MMMVDVLMGMDPSVNDFIIEPEKIGSYISIQDVLGTYQTKLGYIMKFVERDGNLYLQRSGRNDIKLVRETDNVFHQWNDTPFKQEFTKNEKGEMMITAYYPSVAPFSLTKIQSDFTRFDFKSLNGKFTNSETDVSFTLEHMESESYKVKIREQEMTGLLLTPSELLVNDYRLRFSVTDSTINQVFLTSGRIQNVRFLRILD